MLIKNNSVGQRIWTVLDVSFILKMFDELLDLVQNVNGRVRWTNMPLIVDKVRQMCHMFFVTVQNFKFPIHFSLHTLDASCITTGLVRNTESEKTWTLDGRQRPGADSTFRL